ncbi:MAG: hypothetical protein LBD24_08045 [Spirochaetaceae bacterium]|nr:hypothetical protein [Spirochaetaceae bacterium]
MKQPEAAGGCRTTRRPLLRTTTHKPPETARSVAAPGLCNPPNWTKCCTTLKQQAAMLKPSETAVRTS